MIRASAMATIDQVERALDVALRELRQLPTLGSNTYARAAIEYRIGSLRRRRAALADPEAPAGAVRPVGRAAS